MRTSLMTLSVLTLTFPLVTTPALGALADPVTCAKVDPRTGECLITVTSPAVDTTGAPPDQASAPAGSRTTPACYYDQGQREVPCSTEAGYWSDVRQCRISPVQPPPPTDDPMWAGATGGAIYSCALDDQVAGAITTYTFWAATPPPGAAAPVDPADVAQQAIAAMGLRAVDVGIVPEPGTDSVGLVGLPVWMWIDDPAPTTWGPITTSASAGGVTVTATAAVTRVEWSMGDGTIVNCTTAGTEYQDDYGERMSPDCGHRYARASAGRPDDAYNVTATTYWTVDWASAGASGQIDLDFTAETQVQVGELQVLVRG